MAIIESYGTYTLELSPDGTYQVDGHAIRHSDNIIYHYSNGGFIIAADTYDGVKAIVFDVAGGSSPYSSPDSYRVWYTNDSWTQSNTGPNGVSAVNLTPQEIVNTFGAVISGYIPEIPSEAPTAISIDINSIIENSVGSVIGTLTVTDSDVDSYSPHGSTPPSVEVTTPAAGATIGDEFQVNTYVSSDKTMPIITGLNDGGFVTIWESYGQDGSRDGVYGQRYDSSGAMVGAEFQVNTTTTDRQKSPSIIALNDGGFVATWMSNAQDSSGYGVYGQRYDSSGAMAGVEFQVNTTTDNSNYTPA